MIASEIVFCRCFSRSDHLALHMKRHLWCRVCATLPPTGLFSILVDSSRLVIYKTGLASGLSRKRWYKNARSEHMFRWHLLHLHRLHGMQASLWGANMHCRENGQLCTWQTSDKSLAEEFSINSQAYNNLTKVIFFFFYIFLIDNVKARIRANTQNI